MGVGPSPFHSTVLHSDRYHLRVGIALLLWVGLGVWGPLDLAPTYAQRLETDSQINSPRDSERHSSSGPNTASLDFDRDIRAILSDKCFHLPWTRHRETQGGFETRHSRGALRNNSRRKTPRYATRPESQ